MPLTIVIVASSLYTDIQISKNVPPFPPPFPPSPAWAECESDTVLCLVSCSGWKARKVNQRSVSQTLCLVSCSG